MDCKIETNLNKCNCSYEPCPRKGKCCDCLHYHHLNGELPACYFPNDAEHTYDRSIAHFIRINQKKRF